MSDFIKEDVIKNKKSAIKSLNKMLEFFINDSSGKHLKKANLLSYWIKDYVKMIEFEEDFDPRRNIAYKRGDIIKAHFGFNIGSEYGGLHYAVVVNNKNFHSSAVMTVIPLTSQKEEKDIHKNDVDLGAEIYRNLKLKHDTVLQRIQEEQKEREQSINFFNSLMNVFDTTDANSEGFNKLDEVQRNLDSIRHDLFLKSKKYEAQTKQLNKIKAEIDQMKAGSIALVDQITTISKIRVYDPRNAHGVLSGIRLSPEALDKINDKLKELFIF